MKTIQVITTADIPYLIGRYVIQLDHAHEGMTSEEFRNRLGFFAEKRISIITTFHHVLNSDKEDGVKIDRITGYAFSGLRYSHSQVLKAHEFVEEFNVGEEGRYYRLLTLEECIELQKYQFSVRKSQKIEEAFSMKTSKSNNNVIKSFDKFFELWCIYEIEHHKHLEKFNEEFPEEAYLLGDSIENVVEESWRSLIEIKEELEKVSRDNDK
jgi:hypothetical protein